MVSGRSGPLDAANTSGVLPLLSQRGKATAPTGDTAVVTSGDHPVGDLATIAATPTAARRLAVLRMLAAGATQADVAKSLRLTRQLVSKDAKLLVRRGFLISAGRSVVAVTPSEVRQQFYALGPRADAAERELRDPQVSERGRSEKWRAHKGRWDWRVGTWSEHALDGRWIRKDGGSGTATWTRDHLPECAPRFPAPLRGLSWKAVLTVGARGRASLAIYLPKGVMLAPGAEREYVTGKLEGCARLVGVEIAREFSLGLVGRIVAKQAPELGLQLANPALANAGHPNTNVVALDHSTSKPPPEMDIAGNGARVSDGKTVEDSTDIVSFVERGPEWMRSVEQRLSALATGSMSRWRNT